MSIDLFLVLASGQGFLLSFLIIHKHNKLYANRFLALMMFFYSLIFFNLYLEELGYFLRYPLLLILQFGLPFLVIPLHYLYAKYLTCSINKFERKDLLHFTLFLVSECYAVISFSIPNSELSTAIETAANSSYPLVFSIFNWCIIIQGYIYLFMTILLLKKYTHEIKSVFSSIEKIQLIWLRNLTLIFLILLSAFLFENIFLIFGKNLSDYFDFTSILGAIAIYALGYLGFVKSNVFSQNIISESIKQLPQFENKDLISKNYKSDSQKKYRKSGLSKEKAKMYINSLLELMDKERPYRESNLTLNQLAKRLSIKPHNLSEVINTQLHQNFFDVINGYRIEEVKRELIDPKKKHLTFLSIAMDAGFNSKTSFNAIFKKHTQMTPSQYREKNILKNK